MKDGQLDSRQVRTEFRLPASVGYAVGMDAASARFRAVRDRTRPGRWMLVALNLDDLHGPADGVARPPLRLFWSRADRAFDLDRPFMRQEMYQTVLHEAALPEDLTTYLNGQVLTRIWPELFLPRYLREAWEEAHPVLRDARIASAPAA